LKWEPESLPKVSAASTKADAWSGDLLVYGIFADAFEKKEGEGIREAGQLFASFRTLHTAGPDRARLIIFVLHRQDTCHQV